VKYYFIHLIKNWKVAFHALGDFLAHFIHGLLPFINIKHHQPVMLDEYEYDDSDSLADDEKG
jgi:hypothetical protein